MKQRYAVIDTTPATTVYLDATGNWTRDACKAALFRHAIVAQCVSALHENSHVALAWEA